MQPLIVLASASPRRLQLMKALGLDPLVHVSDFDEETLSRSVSPAEYVVSAALGKAMDVAKLYTGLIIGVDTDVVCPDGEILGKPIDDKDATRMLLHLFGKTHTVYSAIVLIDTRYEPFQITQGAVCTIVTFETLSTSALEVYVMSGSPRDKAGGYGIQDPVITEVATVTGDVTSVIGLPTEMLRQLLAAKGIDLKPYVNILGCSRK